MAPAQNPPCVRARALVTAQSSRSEAFWGAITELSLPQRAARSRVHLCPPAELLFSGSDRDLGSDFVANTSVQVHRFLIRAAGPHTRLQNHA